MSISNCDNIVTKQSASELQLSGVESYECSTGFNGYKRIKMMHIQNPLLVPVSASTPTAAVKDRMRDEKATIVGTMDDSRVELLFVVIN